MMTIENSEVLQTEKKHYLLSDETYALLVNAQKEIREATEITPHVRKILAEIITPEAVKVVTQVFIRRYEAI